MGNLQKHWTAAMIPAVDRTLNVALSLTGIILLLPFILFGFWVSWRAIGMNPIFTNQRTGHAGTTFQIWKIRTMIPTIIDGKNSARVHPACRWMRVCKLDELPQLLQVLTGTMVMVGYRPRDLPDIKYLHMSERQYIRWQQMRPGLTGPDALCTGNKDFQHAQFGHNIDQLWEARQGLGRYLKFWFSMCALTTYGLSKQTLIDRNDQQATDLNAPLVANQKAA